MRTTRTDTTTLWTRVVCALLVAAIIACAGLQMKKRWYYVDIVPFICGGEVVRAHADPNALEPLHACEVRRFAEIGKPGQAAVPTPVPLPAYAFLPFMALSLLATPAALTIWYALCLAAVASTILMLRDLTRLSPLAIAAALFVTDFYFAFPLGQMMPIIAAAVTAVAWGFARDRRSLAICAAVVSMIEPNIGLPTALALFVVDTRARIPLVVAGITTAGISLAIAPISEHLEYLTRSLPAQSFSEIHNDEQFSVTHLVSLLYVPDHVAMQIGSTAYAVALIAGVIVASRLARRRELRAIAVVAAPAISLVGSSYSHLHQLVIFGVFGLLVYGLRPRSLAARIGLLGIGLPLIVPETRLDLGLYIALGGLLGTCLWDLRISAGGATALVSGLAVAAFEAVRKHFRRLSPAQIERLHRDLAASVAHPSSASAAFSIFMLEGPNVKLGWWAEISALPLWIGVGCMFLALSRAARRSTTLETVTGESSALRTGRAPTATG